VADDLARQSAAARRKTAAFAGAGLPRLSPAQACGHARLRIGYLSTNFNLHAVSMLTADLFELRDCQRVDSKASR
jgi:predicted O-linked N-acetylglucosamine transferase (SPINDLY family)